MTLGLTELQCFLQPPRTIMRGPGMLQAVMVMEQVIMTQLMSAVASRHVSLKAVVRLILRFL